MFGEVALLLEAPKVLSDGNDLVKHGIMSTSPILLGSNAAKIGADPKLQAGAWSRNCAAKLGQLGVLANVYVGMEARR